VRRVFLERTAYADPDSLRPRVCRNYAEETRDRQGTHDMLAAALNNSKTVTEPPQTSSACATDTSLQCGMGLSAFCV